MARSLIFKNPAGYISAKSLIRFNQILQSGHNRPSIKYVSYPSKRGPMVAFFFALDEPAHLATSIKTARWSPSRLGSKSDRRRASMVLHAHRLAIMAASANLRISQISLVFSNFSRFRSSSILLPSPALWTRSTRTAFRYPSR